MKSKSKSVDIFVKKVDINLLRKQRNYLLNCYDEAVEEYIDGIINLLDYMLDVAEGYEDTTAKVILEFPPEIKKKDVEKFKDMLSDAKVY